MNCAWFKANVHAYAAGALDAGDRASIERHLESDVQHEGCFEALSEALESVAMLDRALVPAVPSGDVWDRIADAIDTPANVTTLRPRPRLSWRETAAWTAALAASILVARIYVDTQALEREVRQQQQQAEQKEQQQVARMNDVDRARGACVAALEQSRTSSDESRKVLALLQHPGTRVVSFTAQGDHSDRASAVVNAETARAYVVSAALPRIAGKDYQLWVIRGSGAPIPAGFARIEADGTAVGEFDAKLLAGGVPDALAVSIEPAGGRPVPTEVILVAKLPS